MRMIFAMQYKKFSQMPIDTTHIGLIKSAGYGVAAVLGGFFGITGVKFAILESLAGLMVLDTLTGVIKWMSIDKQKVKSKGLSEGIMKKIIALFIPLTIGLLSKAMGWQPDVLLTSTFLVLCLSEAYSIIGNLYSAVTKNPAEEFDAISAILKFLKDSLFRFLQSGLKKLAPPAEGNPEQNPDEPTNPTP